MQQNEYYQQYPYQYGQPMPSGQPQNNGRKGLYFWCGLLAGMCVSLLIFCGVYLGKYVELHRNNSVSQTASDSNQTASAVSDDMIEKLEMIEQIINVYFYEDDIDPRTLEEGAYRGMVEALGDPYSEYYTAEELEALYQDTEGIYYGIGAYVTLDTATGYCRISGVIAGTPAEEAGVQENDIIYKVEGEDMYGLSTQEVVSRIKGEEGTTVHITFYRNGEEVELDIVRRKVESPTVYSEMYEGGIAYIQITEFDSVTVDQFAEALAVARGKGMQGLILDLRSNPGGSLGAVVSIAQQLLPKGLVVYTEDKYGHRTEYSCDGKREIEVPMVVLINGNSASASEILAGAIKDYGVGVLLGTTTYGKGIVQRPVELSDGSAVKLTVSAYYTPNGTNIHGIGIEPDEECIFDGERYYSEENYDNQLERAKELAAELIAAGN